MLAFALSHRPGVSSRPSTYWNPVRVLLDERAPRKLRQELPGHDVSTLQEMGWAGLKNGPLEFCAQDRDGPHGGSSRQDHPQRRMLSQERS